MFNTYRNDMKYLLIPFIILLVACEQSNTPSPLKTDVINIEMGGVFYDNQNNTEYQTEVGDAYILIDWEDGKDPEWEVMDGCQYKHPERTDRGAYVFALGQDDTYYYFFDIDFKILKNPENFQNHLGYEYSIVDETTWEIKRGSTIFIFDSKEKSFSKLFGWSYSW